ncbi:MAG: hypothetical protein AB1439_04465 [candidate division FCPU426 bacterium]
MKTSWKIGRYVFFAMASLLILSAPALADISGVTASPAPSTVNTNAQYTLGFTTGATGALTTSDTINITFLANTTVPANFPGGAGGQVTVNGTTATATGSGQTLTITVPRDDIGNSTPVTVVITTGAANLVNPSIPGTTYQVTMSTSVESAGVTSGNYTISASGTALSVGSVTVTPSTIGNTATCSINATLGADGALWGGNSQIVITFPAGTGVYNGTITGVTVNGTAATSATGNPSARTITIVPQQNIANGAGIAISIPASAYRNPTSTGSVNLTAYTSAQTSTGTSSAYSITTSGTAVTVGTVTPSPNTIGNIAQYSIDFNTASDGALVGGVSTITVTFPVGTTVTDGAIAGVTVEGVAATSAIGTSASRTVVITPGQDIYGGLTNRTIVIPSGGSAIRNPITANSYTLTVSTSVQLSTGTSSSYTIGLSSTAVTVVSVTPSPTTINNYAQYTIDFNTSSDGGLVGGTSTITVVFPNDTVVADGAIANVTVEGTPASSATGTAATRTVVITPAQNFNGGTNNITIFIPSTGNAIRNPSTANNYTLTVDTSVQNVGTSPAYTIGGSSTPVTVVSVAPSPNTIGNIAQYTIDFNTSADGALVGGSSTITVTFPAGTVVANGSITGVTVEGLAATSATGSSASRTITITPQQSFSGSTSNITIFIPSTGSALRNPTTAGNYTLTVATSVQPVGTSPNYAIGVSGTPVTVVSAAASPNTIGNLAQYTIDFNTASDGGLVGGTSTITVTFPVGTTVIDGAISGVTVEGMAATSATGTSATRTVVIVPQQNFSGSTSNITIVIPTTSSPVRNPMTAASYTLNVATSVQTTAGTSPSYTIGLSSTAVSIDSVTPSPTTIGNQASYDIQFDLASDGGLVGGTSTITIVFPSDTVVQNGAIAGVTVEGTPATSATGNSGTRTIVVTPAQNLNGGTLNINVVIPTASLRNPTTASSYTLTVDTSVQNVGTSPSYSIGLSSTTVVVTSVVPSPNTISQSASYTVDFNTSADGALIGGTSTIVVTFPNDTVVQNGAFGGVTVEGIAASSATGSIGARTVTITPAQNLSGGTNNITIFMPSGRITNPSSSGNYQLTVTTSVQPAGNSPQYVIGISSTTVNVSSVSVAPAIIGNPALYTIDFDISSDGGLVGGTSTITVTFPAGTYVTNGALAGVTVEGIGAFSATGNNGARTIAIVPTQSLTGGTTNVTLSIPTTAVRNPTTAGNYTLTVATSLQPAGTSPQYSLGLSGTTLAVGSVTVSPTVVGNQASYQFDFNTASDGYLVGGTSTITITFPSDTNVTNGALGGVTVESLGATSATGNTASRTITIVPQQNIPGGTNNVTVFIPATAVRNPTSIGNYTLTASTSPQPAGTSPQYSLGQSSTSVTFGSVVPNPSTIGNQAQYTINFNTAADGALVGGASHIIITFPNDTVITNGAIAGVTVEGSAATSAIGNSASRSIDIVPSNNISGSYTNVTVIIPSAGIRNPTTGGSYTLTVSTTPQPVGTSPSYNIGQSGTTVNVTAVTPSPNTIGNQSQYTIDFNTSSDGALLGTISQIVVTFPSDTVVTNGALAGVTVEGLAASSATGNSAGRTVTIVPSQNIPGGTASVTLLIPSTVLRNPTTINTYTLTVATTVQPAGTSPGYSIGQSLTTVNVTAVTPNPATIGNPAQYTIQFTTSADGALLAGTSTITILFPNDTDVTNGPLSGITVGGAAASATGSSALRRIIITTPNAIAVSTSVAVVIPSTALTNPSVAGNYSLTLATSVQPAGTSPLYGIGLSSTAISVTSVTPNPTVVGNLAAYTVVFSTSSDGAIPAGTGNIIITFPNDTNVPTGALSGITINSVAPTSATGDTGTRRITLVPSANISASTSVTVVIPLSVSLRNPTATGSYTLSVASSAQPAGTSPAYSITQSVSTVSISGVTPNPTTVGSDAQYTVNFTTSADGPLYSGISRIYINFPSNTFVTTGAISGILVNGVAPSSATGNGGTRQINILIGANINASTGVVVVIPSADLHNPTNAGNYTLTVSTTAQPAGTSPAYAITLSGTPVNVTAVNPTSNVVNINAGYTVTFNPAVVLRGNTSGIFLIFPPSTVVPGSLLTTDLTVAGVNPFSVACDPASRLISIIPSSDITAGSSTSVAIPGLVIMNPSIPGSVPMSVSTTAQPTGTLNYTINASSSIITTPSVTPNPSRAGEIAEYPIAFSVGAQGRLMAGNTISVQFPVGTTFPSSIPAGAVTVNSIGNTGTLYAVGNYVHVVVPPGVSVANNGAVSLVFTTAALIRNPGQGGTRLDDVHTDAEPTAVPSNFYIITADSQLTAPTVTPNPNALYATAEYTVTFRLGASGSLDAGVDHIYIVFNSATTLPTTVSSPGQITVNGTPVTAVSRITNGFNILSPIDIAAGASDKTVTIVFRTGIGIQNPTLPGSYTLQAYTSIENTPVTSNPYTIAPSSSTQITQPQLDLSPGFINSYARYQISFSVGSLGALAADLSTIVVVFPNEFTLPASIARTDILVNNTELNADPAIAGQTLTITTPIAIPLSGAVTLTFLSTSHIQNPSITGSYTLTLSTSSEPTPVVSTAVQIRPSTWDDVVGYPNPLKYAESVNKCFTFLFLPDRNVTLRLYTLDGKLVKTITKNDTTDRIVWNLDNERSKIVASGIYLYVIKGTTGEKRGKIGFLK